MDKTYHPRRKFKVYFCISLIGVWLCGVRGEGGEGCECGVRGERGEGCVWCERGGRRGMCGVRGGGEGCVV